MDTSTRNLIAERLRDADYRATFVEQSVRRFLPAQIRSMRDERGWNQEELGRRCGKTQEWISKLESQTYGRYSTQTLIDLARGFDVGLIIRLASFGSFLDWYTSDSAMHGIPSFTDDTMVTPSKNTTTPHLRLVAAEGNLNPAEPPTFTSDQGKKSVAA